MNKIIKNIVLTFAIGTGVFLVGSVFFNDFRFNSAKAFLITFGFYQLYAFVLGFSNMTFFAYLASKNWEATKPQNRIIAGFVGSTIITLIGLFFLRAFTATIYQNQTFSDFLANESLRNYSFGLIITLFIVTIFHLVYYYNEHQKNKVKEQKVIASAASAKFDALKNQLDPHFLFNSLNVLTSLIEENPKNAQRFTTSLSKVYRYVLEQKNKDLVSVNEELEFAKTYMLLLKMRFEDSLVFEIPNQAKNPDNKVVPLALQLLLENAVKHNVVTQSKPLKIRVYEEKNTLVIQNNLQKKQILNKNGVGLENIKQRYQLLTQKEIEIIQTETHFKVAIPMLK